VLYPRQFERRVAATGNAGLAVLLVFFAALAYWQVFRTDLAGHKDNPRVASAFNDPHRGRLLDRDGNELAVSLPSGQRRYTDASVAHEVGYIDSRFGSTGAELAFNGLLSGRSGEGGWQAAFDAEFKRTTGTGLDVRLTIDPKVQRAASQALGARNGAVVALDPRNGEVLAMVSVPTFDPGALAKNGDALVKDPTSPLLNRATQGSYPPGSTFKTVTAISALENNVITPDTVVTCPGEIVVDGFPISCNNVPQGTGTYPFRNAFTYSVNAIFAQVGISLGWDRLNSTARRLGFGRPLEFTLETAPTQIHAPGSKETKTLLATTAFGQGELLATPLEMAAITAAIANDGTLVSPHLGLAAMDGKAVVARLEEPSASRLMSSSVARTLREFMVAVVDASQAAGVSIPGVKVGGKTGTAETGSGTSHAWFIAFAPAENPTIVVAVVLENAGRGSVEAAPVAGAVLRAALAR
jgi:peptidoglycan glycosyltransferase